ncbi:MAG TPA: DUF2905 domain-containing protein [Actinomycetota bacterium]|nr:DUF2905 domain-containing protein [Actinomycetota bacterium]
MDGFEPVGRALVIIGVFLTVLGAIMLLTPRVPWLGRLPGDIVIHRDDLTIYIPITTMLIVSVVLSVVLSVISRGR